MSNPNPPLENLKPFKPGQSGNPKGQAKGTIHLSTHIQNMLNDEDFDALLTTHKGPVEYKGAPIKAIIRVAIHKALYDKEKGQQWAEWLAKHGYGNTLNLNVNDPLDSILTKFGIDEDGDARKTESPKS